MKFKLNFTTSPGGWWLLDFTRLMQSHLPTIVKVEVEDELGNYMIMIKITVFQSPSPNAAPNFGRFCGRRLNCHSDSASNSVIYS